MRRLASRSPVLHSLALLASCLLVSLASAQDIKLLANINTDNTLLSVRSSTPSDFAVLGNRVLFAATDWLLGRELWVTEGRPGTTRLLKDIHPYESSSPSSLTTIGALTWFVAEDEAHGREPWVTDGTAAGTRMVADIAPGAQSSQVRPGSDVFVPLGRLVMFVATDGVHGLEPWVSDGTAAGSRLLADVRPGPAHSDPSDAVVLGSYLYFAADDGVTGRELWRTDGTTAGATLFADLDPVASSNPGSLCVDSINGVIYFVATTTTLGRELWRTDGTPTGTRIVRDLNPGPGSTTFLDRPRVAGGTLYIAVGATAGSTLWRSDGTPAGTTVVRAPAAGGPTDPYRLTPVGNRVFFFGSDVAAGSEPWVTDGTAAGTMRLADTVVGPASAQPQAVTADGQFVDFATRTTPYMLWRTDLTPAGTRLLANLRVSSMGARPGGGTVMSATDAVGTELWASDGTAAGTARLLDLAPTPFDKGSRPGPVWSLGTFALFAATDATHGTELWRTDGTTRGTQMVIDLVPGPGASRPSLMGVRGGRAFFTILGGQSLWVTDGTAPGTLQLTPPGITASFVAVLDSDRVVFQHTNAQPSHELWVSDGTSSGARFVSLLNSGPSRIERAVRADDRHFAVITSVPFSSTPPTLLWSDGTTRGTRSLGPISTHGGNDVAVGGRVFSSDSVGGPLWVSDGTSAGTHMLSSSTRGVAVYQDAAWFVDWRGVLWRSDGTLAGTRPTVALGGAYDLRIARTWSDGLLLVDQRREATESRRSMFWSSDGTAGGTRLLATVPGVAFVAGSLGTQHQALICDARQNGESTHYALWTLDRAGALRWITNVPAEYAGDEPFTATVGGKLVIAYDDGVMGRELWVWDPGATATPMPTGCAANRRAELTCDDPRLGTTISIAGGSTPASAIVALWLGAPTLPMPRVGACSLAALPEVLVATFQPAAPDWVRTLPIPNQSRLLGAQTVLQAAWAPTPSGVDVSNGVLLTFGR